LDWEWMWPLLVRNIIGTWVLCGLWDWFLYLSPMAYAFKPYKIINDYPTLEQMKHDSFWTTSASVTGTMCEWLACHLMASGACKFDANMSDSLLKNVWWAFFLVHVREPHFYSVHRFMHPWRKSWIYDFGKPMYKYVHSLHHRSYNTTAFSGTSMHPVESTMYYSSCFVPMLFGCHPAIMLATIVDCGIAAWLGHSGFVFPGAGDIYHQIHHVVFDCNYGGNSVPMDLLMGTYASNYEDVKKIWVKSTNQKVGIEGNTTKVHAKGNKEKVM